MPNAKNHRFNAFVFLILVLACPVAAEAAGSTLDKIRETGAITIGYRESSIPFSYLGPNQEPIGFSLDLCAPIVEHVKSATKLDKIKVHYVPVNSSNRIPLLQNGAIDIECGGTANSVERQKQVAFTVATFVSQPRWLTKRSSGIANVQGLGGKVIVVTQGSNAVGFAQAIDNKMRNGFRIVQGKDHAESLLMLESDRAAAFMEDDILLAGLKVRSPNSANLVFLPDTYDKTVYGLMVRKDDPAFKAVADDTLKGMMADGTFLKLYAKWFQSPIPPNGDNLNFSPSDELKERIAHPSDKAED